MPLRLPGKVALQTPRDLIGGPAFLQPFTHKVADDRLIELANATPTTATRIDALLRLDVPVAERPRVTPQFAIDGGAMLPEAAGNFRFGQIQIKQLGQDGAVLRS